MSHTPEPWRVGSGTANLIVYGPTGYAVANAVVHHGRHEAEQCEDNQAPLCDVCMDQ